MRPRRQLPSIKRMLVEYVAMVMVYFAVLAVTTRFFGGANVILAIIAMLATLFVARATRPKNDMPPPPGGPPPGSPPR